MVFDGDRRFLAHEGSPKHSHNRAALEQSEIERNFWNLTRGKTNNEVTTVPGHRAHSGFGVFASYGIIDDIHALSVSELLDSLAQVFRVVIYQIVSPELFACCEFFIR